MRLAYLDPHAVPDDCPEALQILYTVDALGDIGVDVDLVTPKPRRAIAAENILGHPLSARVKLHHLPDPRRRWWFPSASNKPFYFLASRLLRRLRADVVLVRNLKMAEYLIHKVPRSEFVFETHEIFAQTYREDHPTPTVREQLKLQALEQREALVYRRAAGLLALTPLLIEDIRAQYHIETPAIVVPDGVDLAQAKNVTDEAASGVPILLYLGSLHPWKGVDTLISAMQYVTRPSRLVIVGGSQERIGELRAQAQSQGIDERVNFIGAVEPGRRFEWIHRADICLLPLTPTSIGSRYTSPLKLFEYMAAGKPIVVSDLPSMRAVLDPDRHALLVKNGDASAFAAAIDSLLEDKTLQRRLGEAALARAGEFSWRKRAERIAAFLESLQRTR